MTIVRRLLLAVVFVTIAGCQTTTNVDTLIRDVDWFDGSGAPSQRVSIAIHEGRVVAIGDLSNYRSDDTIDGDGRALAPGFIDLHSHADLILLADAERRAELLEAKIRQGVTTLVVGNCGLGVAPADEPTAALLSGINQWMTPQEIAAGTLTVGAYLDRLQNSDPPLNVATLVPHGPLRIEAMGLTDGAPDAAQLEAMQRRLREALSDGAFGLSVGLIYPPGMFSDTDELTALASTVSAENGLFTAHIRGSSETLLDAVDELVTIATDSGARTHHSHLEAVGRDYWDDVATILEREDAARSDGVTLSHDVFPYERAATMMAAIFPPWSLDGGVPQLLERLRDPATRERIRRDIAEQRPEWPPWQPGGWPHNLVSAVGWDGILVASVGSEAHRDWVGRSLSELATEHQTTPFDLVADLMLAEGGAVGQLVAEISGDALPQIVAHPASAIVSDAEDYGRGVPHPAHAGAFARALRMAREHSIEMTSMLHKMTQRPATILGTSEVGELQVGDVADLVLFDPAAVHDRADWNDPRAFASGIDAVMIGGAWVVRDGAYRPTGNGRVLRATAEPPS